VCWLSSLGALQLVALRGALCSGHGRIQHRSTYFIAGLDRYNLHIASCKIWSWVVYFILENKATLYKKIGVQNRWVFKSCNFQKPPPPNTPLVLITHKERLCLHISIVNAGTLYPPTPTHTIPCRITMSLPCRFQILEHFTSENFLTASRSAYSRRQVAWMPTFHI
jgi:hypothetical protein